MAIVDARVRQIELLKGIHQFPDINPRLWATFAEITTIPRPSHNEKPMVDYLELLAINSGFKYERDEANNIFIHVPATPGYENAPKIILQDHSDMVPRKDEDAEYDPAIHGVHAMVLDDGTIKADKTTLGADNGIGIAMALTLASDPEAKHGDLGILVTSNEEDGLGGAEKLKFESMRDFNFMLNLDSENEGKVTIGSAGGAYSHISMPIEHSPIEESKKLYSLNIGGLKGGHSGLKIDLGGKNSIKAIGEILTELSKKIDINLVSIKAGDVMNSIPTNADITFAVDESRASEVEKLIAEIEEKMKESLTLKEDREGFRSSLTEAEKSGFMLTRDSTNEVLGLISDLPHGVRNKNDKGVITSTNLANIVSVDNELRIGMMSRSSVPKELDAQLDDIGQAANEVKHPRIKIVNDPPYAGWLPNEQTLILQRAKAVYKEHAKPYLESGELESDELKVEVTHGGLECGVIGNKFPNLSEATISIGSQINGAHETTENTGIRTNERTYLFVRSLVNDLSTLVL